MEKYKTEKINTEEEKISKIARKMKLWQKQKKGKEKLREKSRYTIPSDVFLKVMK